MVILTYFAVWESQQNAPACFNVYMEGNCLMEPYWYFTQEYHWAENGLENGNK
jgi:hypothetical protein